MPDTNTLMDDLRAQFDAALARETQIRTNYESGLIPQLQGDLQATRNDLIAVTVERDALLKWKQRSEDAFIHVEAAYRALSSALNVAPGEAPVEHATDEALPPSWR